MELRNMQLSDLDQVMELEKRQSKPWERYSFGQAMRLGHRCVVVEENDRIIAYAVADKGHGRIIFSLSPNASLMLFRKWREEAIEAGVTVLWAETPRENVDAISLLMKYGFTKQGTRPSYYGPGEDATVWSRPCLTDTNIGYQGRSPLQVIEPV